MEFNSRHVHPFKLQLFMIYDAILTLVQICWGLAHLQMHVDMSAPLRRVRVSFPAPPAVQ